MSLTGGCYCGSVRYEAGGAPMFKGQCHCRECQYITGGGANLFMVMSPAEFKYTKGAPAQFARDDIANPVTREFCPKCGTHLVTRAGGGAMVIVKIGTLDDPSVFEGPQMAIWMKDAQPYHLVAEGVPQTPGMPG